MAISTYSELKTAIANHLNRSDLTDRIPEFIVLAEQMLAGDPYSDIPGVRARAQEKRVTASISGRYSDMPSDLLSLRNVQITTAGSIRRLRYVTPEQMDYIHDSASSGAPEHYTIIGDELQVSPAPDATYTAEIAYTARFAALSDANTTNWLLTNYPFIYVYGALVGAEPYLSNDSRMQTWVSMYRSLVNALNTQEQKATYGGSAMMMRNDVGNP